MNKFFATLFVLPLLLWGCAQEEEILPEQQKKTVSFLTSSHQPRLVAEADLDPESELPYYTTNGKSVYRYIANIYDPARKNWPSVTSRSKVTITFRAYLFTYTSIVDTTMPYYSNDPLLEEAYYAGDVGLTPGVWKFEPLVIDMARPEIIKGLYLALIGQRAGDECRQGDIVEAYMTYNLAYGDKGFTYVIPPQSPLAYFFTVDKVE